MKQNTYSVDTFVNFSSGYSQVGIKTEKPIGVLISTEQKTT